jgi:hypothetical protein
MLRLPWWWPLLVILPVGLAAGLFVGLPARSEEPQKDPLAQCQIEVERLRAYSSILKGDRDQKEAALAEYGVQLRTLQAEIARLKEPKKETK